MNLTSKLLNLWKLKMSKIYEITVVSGKYTNKDGVEKSRYQNIGSVIETKNGPMLKLDSIPLPDGGWNGWAYLNTPKPKDDYKGLPKDEDIDF
jgi:hypothetical protein